MTSSDIKLLLEATDIFKEDEEQLAQSLQSLACLCAQDGGSTSFRECQGLEKILELFFAAKSNKIKGLALYTLGNSVENCKASKKLLCRKELLSFFSGNLLSIENELLLRMALYFLMSLCSKFCSAQDLVRSSGCLEALLELFKNKLPSKSKPSKDPSNWIDTVEKTEDDDEVWVTVCATLSAVMNNPQNAKNQVFCCTVIPKALVILRTDQKPSVWFSGIHFISQCLDSNDEAQKRFSMISGYSILIEFLMAHFRCHSDLKEGTLSLVVSSISSALDISAEVKDKAGKQGLVKTLIEILKEKGSYDDDFLSLCLYCLAKAVQQCHTNTKILQDNNGVKTIITCLNNSEKASMVKAGLYILESVLPNKEEQEEKPKAAGTYHSDKMGNGNNNDNFLVKSVQNLLRSLSMQGMQKSSMYEKLRDICSPAASTSRLISNQEYTEQSKNSKNCVSKPSATGNEIELTKGASGMPCTTPHRLRNEIITSLPSSRFNHASNLDSRPASCTTNETLPHGSRRHFQVTTSNQDGVYASSLVHDASEISCHEINATTNAVQNEKKISTFYPDNHLQTCLPHCTDCVPKRDLLTYSSHGNTTPNDKPFSVSKHGIYNSSNTRNHPTSKRVAHGQSFKKPLQQAYGTNITATPGSRNTDKLYSKKCIHNLNPGFVGNCDTLCTGISLTKSRERSLLKRGRSSPISSRPLQCDANTCFLPHSTNLQRSTNNSGLVLEPVDGHYYNTGNPSVRSLYSESHFKKAKLSNFSRRRSSSSSLSPQRSSGKRRNFCPERQSGIKRVGSLRSLNLTNSSSCLDLSEEESEAFSTLSNRLQKKKKRNKERDRKVQDRVNRRKKSLIFKKKIKARAKRGAFSSRAGFNSLSKPQSMMKQTSDDSSSNNSSFYSPVTMPELQSVSPAKEQISPRMAFKAEADNGANVSNKSRAATPLEGTGLLTSVKNILWSAIKMTPLYRRKQALPEGKCLGCYPFSRFPLFVLNARNYEATLRTDKFTCDFHKSFLIKSKESDSNFPHQEVPVTNNRDTGFSSQPDVRKESKLENQCDSTELKSVANDVPSKKKQYDPIENCSRLEPVTTPFKSKRPYRHSVRSRGNPTRQNKNRKCKTDDAFGFEWTEDEALSSCTSVTQVNLPPSKCLKRRHRKEYSKEEIEYIVKGVLRYGKRWTTILHSYDFSSGRTGEDLKDKYRQLKKKSELPGLRNHRLRFNTEEIKNLMKGIHCYGEKWTVILDNFSFKKGRTASDLEAKWKTIKQGDASE